MMRAKTMVSAAVAVAIAVATQAGAKDVGSGSFIDAQGKAVGTVTVMPMASATVFQLDLTGLPPGPHAIHVHAVGTCAPPGFESAGPHFNPHAKQHGLNNPQGHHAGDLPNITVREDGTLQTQIVIGPLPARGDGGLADGDGAAVVIHASVDDYVTDPAGNAGARIACAVLNFK